MSTRPSTARPIPSIGWRQGIQQPARYNGLPILSLLMLLLVGVSLTGCIGLTGAQPPASKTTSQAPSNQLPGRQPVQTQSDSGSAPVVTTQPVSAMVAVGQSATFSVAVTGTIPLNYQWSRNGVAINGAVSASYTTAATTNADNGAVFSVVVSNSAGSATSANATLTVTPTATQTPTTLAPAVITQPVSQMVTAGQSATFSVAASGTAPLSYQWNRNGAAIGGAMSASYTTAATTTADNGAVFSVVVSNSAGSATSANATLTVTSATVAPAVTTQPVSQTVTSGQSATFSVAASGTGPLSYQWKRNGNSINGATSASFTTAATTTADNGALFSAVVSNTAGSATSSNATLTVNMATLLLSTNLSSVNFGSVNVSSNSGSFITLTNAGNSNVTVSNVSIGGPGFNASGVSTGQTLAPGQSATLNVTFAPAGAGSVTGSVTVTSNATNSPTTIGLAGSGVQAVVSHSVILTWGASTSSVAGYNIYRAGISGGPYAKLNTSVNGSLTVTDKSVQGGQQYYYVVTSVDASSMESAYSNEVSVLVPTP